MNVSNLPARRQLHSVFAACEYRNHLYVSGPLDFSLVIQVLLSPCMILHKEVHHIVGRVASHNVL